MRIGAIVLLISSEKKKEKKKKHKFYEKQTHRNRIQESLDKNQEVLITDTNVTVSLQERKSKI